MLNKRLLCWMSIMLIFCVCLVEYLRSWDLCLSCWASQSLSIVSSVEYLRYWDLCVMCEYLRSWDLCLPYLISQVLRSVSSALNISALKICVTPWWKSQILSAVSTAKNISDSEVCVRCAKYPRVSSLCHTCQKTQSLKSVPTWWIPQYSWSVSNV